MELVVQVGKVEEIPHIRVPFSVTSKKLVVVGLVWLLLGFNAIKVLAYLVSNTEALTKLFQVYFQSSYTVKLKNIVNFIQKANKMNEQLEEQMWWCQHKETLKLVAK